MSDQSTETFDAVVIGAGFAGLYSLYRLRNLGLSVKVFEAGDGVGGTWYWNRYPGARCDVESMEYSYSFDPELEQEWVWPDKYSKQSDILRYANHVAERYDLLKDIQFETRIKSAFYDRDTNTWTIETTEGQKVRAQYCIMAVGNLSTPRVPDFKGVDSFKGDWYHSGLWPKKEVDFSGKRVGIIGTGSTAIQIIPHVARQAKHLTIFQRTANYSLPARNGPLPEDVRAAHKKKYRELREQAYFTPFGIAGYPPPKKGAIEATPEERDAKYHEKWAEGGTISYLFSYPDLRLREESQTASDFVRDVFEISSKTRRRRSCSAQTIIRSARNSCLDGGYYETFNRDNVSLVDVRSAPIEGITPDGLRTTKEEFELDSLIFATGFDAMTGAILEMDVRTSDGADMKERWKDGPKTYLGIMVSGFPNMFVITGPGSPGVKSQMILSIEQHTDWITNCIENMRAKGINRAEADADAEVKWVEHVNEVANSTLYPQANSWYVGANIPGKPRIFMPYVGGVEAYKKICDEVVEKGYEGITLSP